MASGTVKMALAAAPVVVKALTADAETDLITDLSSLSVLCLKKSGGKQPVKPGNSSGSGLSGKSSKNRSARPVLKVTAVLDDPGKAIEDSIVKPRERSLVRLEILLSDF